MKFTKRHDISLHFSRKTKLWCSVRDNDDEMPSSRNVSRPSTLYPIS